MIIFLAGAHGVGKTYLATRTAARFGLRNVTASQLIREELGRPNWTQDRRVQDVDANQEALIAAVKRSLGASEQLLLDGHFVLRGPHGELLRLDLTVFSQLGISATVLVEAPHQVVAERLAQRGAPVVDLVHIQVLAAAEREHARRVCSALRVPITSLMSPTEEEFAQAIEMVLSQVRSGLGQAYSGES